MSEEEKKAIEELEDFIEDDEIQNISVFTAKKIKNIIEKQRKEIEELKNNELDYTTIYMNGIYDGEKKVKDKIREIIKELEDNNERIKKNKEEHTTYYKIILRKNIAQIYILKELLEENTNE